MDARRIIIGMVFGVIAIRLTITKGSCRIYILSMPFNGIFCIGDGQSRYMCLQCAIFEAYNYNITDGTCTRLRAPPPQAFADALMEFALFTEKSSDQCYYWLPYIPGDAIDPRMVQIDTVCYFHTSHKTCYGSSGSIDFANTQVYPCQRLRVSEDCTVSWVPYIAREPVHQIYCCWLHLVAMWCMSRNLTTNV